MGERYVTIMSVSVYHNVGLWDISATVLHHSIGGKGDMYVLQYYTTMLVRGMSVDSWRVYEE